MGVPLQLCMTAVLPLYPIHALSQTAAEPPKQALTVTTRLVFVPVLVRSPAGDLVHELSASDFELLGDSVPQKVSLEPSSPQPLPTAYRSSPLTANLKTNGASPRRPMI